MTQQYRTRRQDLEKYVVLKQKKFAILFVEVEFILGEWFLLYNIHTSEVQREDEQFWGNVPRNTFLNYPGIINLSVIIILFILFSQPNCNVSKRLELEPSSLICTYERNSCKFSF